MSGDRRDMPAFLALGLNLDVRHAGIGLGSFNDIKTDDVVETFEMREVPRK